MLTPITLLLLQLQSQSITIGDHQFEYRLLDNGLRAYAIQDDGDTASVFMAIAAGSRDETADTTGLAHLTEHALFTGTATTGTDVHEKTVVEWGGESNAFTRDDYTMYYDHDFDPSKLSAVLAMEADRLRGLTFDKDAVLHERDRLTAEELHSYQPSDGRVQQLENAVFTAHPYRHGLRDAAGHTKAPTLSIGQIKFFYNFYYHPNRTAIVVVGPQQASEVLDLVESSFGQIKSKAITNNNYFEPEIASSRSVELVSDLPRDRVVRNWLTPQLGHSDRAALDVLAAMLQRDEIASGVVVNVEIGQRLEQDIFSMGWSVGGNDPQLVSKQVWRMLTDYKLAEVNESVLSEVKAQLADTYSSLPMRSRPYFALAGTLAWHAAHDKVDALVGYYDAVMAVSADDLARVTKFYLAKSKCVTVTFKGTGEEVKPLPSGYQELQAAAAAANEVGDFARAIEAYTRILEIKKDPMSQIINLTERGVIHLELKNYDAAIADFEAGLTYYDYPAVADMLRDAIAQKKRAMRGRVR